MAFLSMKSTRGTGAVEALAIVGLVGMTALVGVRASGAPGHLRAPRADPHAAIVPHGSAHASNGFVAGTLVLTPKGLVAVETLHEGDDVVSWDEHAQKTAIKPISKTFVNLAPALVDVAVVDADGLGDTLRATPEHAFWAQGAGWLAPGTLAVRQPLMSDTGLEVDVVAKTDVHAEDVVYAFDVEDTHAYFVGVASVLVHSPRDAFEGAVSIREFEDSAISK